MNDQSPPGYSTSASVDTASPPVLLNLSPPQDSTTFQLGYLGHGQAFVAGEVQIKFEAAESRARPAFSKLVIVFRGIERVHGVDPIELCEQKEVLWGEGAAGASSSSNANTSASHPPTNSPFKLHITPDLPVCLHLGTSSLEYSLTVELHFSEPSLPPVVRCAPVHLVRTSPPGSRLSDVSLSPLSNSFTPSISPTIVSNQDQFPFSVKLPKTIFHRGEPVELVARVEIPSVAAVGEGLRLRTISAELVRTIDVNLSSSGSTSSASETGCRHRTILAHSGKSARFSPNRPIVIRLVLHPPAELSCESITQSTILHSVSFAVKVTIGLSKLNGHPGSRSLSTTSSDAVLSQPILIIPATPTLTKTAKQKEVEEYQDQSRMETEEGRWSFLASTGGPLVESPGEGSDGPVPSYVEHGADDPGVAATASTSAGRLYDLEMNGEEDEEYDGYEELSIPTEEAGPPPPAIDDDISPPSPSDIGHPTPSRDTLLSPPSAAGLNSLSSNGSFLPVSYENPSDFALPLASTSCSPPCSEPSSPPPPLSPLSVSRDDYPLPSNVPSNPPYEPLSRLATAANESPPILFSENLPPPYIGSSAAPPPPPRLTEQSFSPQPSSQRSSSPSPPCELSRSRHSQAPVPLAGSFGEEEQENLPNENLQRDPPPYQEEAIPSKA